MSDSDPRPPGESSERPPPAPAPPLGLDPGVAAEPARRAPEAPRTPTPVIDTKRYRWAIGAIGLVIVAVVSVVSFLQHGVVSAGVPAHQRLRDFAAPLALSTLDGVANVSHPTCSAARHDLRALNLCLLVKRGPLVLAFFVAGAKPCTQEVDTMQIEARRFPSVQFAAVAVKTSHAAAARAARLHRWTIPVAYDADGAVGLLYGIEACPLVELAYRGGIVADRLIGENWARPAALAPRVHDLLASEPQ